CLAVDDIRGHSVLRSRGKDADSRMAVPGVSRPACQNAGPAARSKDASRAFSTPGRRSGSVFGRVRVRDEPFDARGARPLTSRFRSPVSAAAFIGAWRSLVAHLLWEQRVGGSNPSAPTTVERVGAK